MTLEEFEREIGQFGEEIRDLDLAITEYLRQKVTEMQSLAPEDTGELKRSIKLTGDRYNFQIKMNYYGVFQNYGVAGTKSSKIPVNRPEAGLSIGSTVIDQQPFSFGTGNFNQGGKPWGAYYTGIRATSFFSISDIADELENIIINNI